MRFHVISLAHTQTTKEYLNCAYTQKVRNFVRMMKSLDHTVFLYASEDNDVECDELITCITKEEQKDFVGVEGPADVLKAPFDTTMPHWTVMNHRAIKGIRERAEAKDFICIIAGGCQKSIVDAFPNLLSVEFGVGYPGVLDGFRVFESYAWMHTVYGWKYGMPAGTQGKFYDRVIPNYFDPDDFPFSAEKDDYYLFIGRLNEDKGVGIAAEVSKAMDMPLVVAGQGSYLPQGVDYRGLVQVEERGELMSRAQLTFVPTLYLEPFGGVSVESMFCGTPVLTTDWGAFSENVQEGLTGFRCRTLQAFIDGARNIKSIDPAYCREYAVKNFSMNVVRYMYQDYFEDLSQLFGKGWYARTS